MDLLTCTGALQTKEDSLSQKTEQRTVRKWGKNFKGNICIVNERDGVRLASVKPLAELWKDAGGLMYIRIRDPEGLIDDLFLRANSIDSPWYEDPDKRHRRRYQTYSAEYEGGIVSLMDHTDFKLEETPKYVDLRRKWKESGDLIETRKAQVD